MYSWGSAINGELGQGGVEDVNITTPTKIKFNNVKTCSISVGGRHTLMLTESGELYSCGSNDFGQLGREGSQTRLEQVTSLSEYTVKQISSGANHSLAVDQWGSTFSWGSDECGQLGHNQGAQALRVPRLIKALGTIKVSRVSCGMYHSAVLTAGGQLYTWGSNSKGQLGLGAEASRVFSPTLVETLAGVPLAGVVCGGNHTLVVSVSGALFSFGSNSHGQLGLGDTEDKFLPTQVRTLRYQSIGAGGLAAGSEHSVALTADGGVFTWGSSRYGQLGHGSNNTENQPKKILELMGTRVTQVSAGDRHTLALVPARNKLYAFGVAGSGQLGRGPDITQNANVPQIVAGDVIGRISLISAGGNSSWLSVGPKEYSQLDTLPALRLLDRPLLDSLAAVKQDDMLEPDLMEEIELVFSSLSCINGSLLLPSHHGCKGSNCGLDFSGWKEAFSIIKNCKNDTVPSLVMSGLLSVLGQLKASPPDVEALRYYLVLPMHECMSDPANAKEFQIPYADAVLGLQKNAIKVVEKWIGNSPQDQFKHLIDCYKQVLIPFLKRLKSDPGFEPQYSRDMMVALVFLTFLTRVNEESGSPVNIDYFYIPKLDDYCDLKVSYCDWKVARMRGEDTTTGFYICNFPFLFDPIAKEVVLMADQEFSQRIAQQNAVQDAMFQMMTSGQGLINPFLQISVSRENIVHDTIAQLEFISYESQANFKKPLRISFRGEEAEDEGGVTKEFFLLLMKEILNPDYGMFKEYDETNTIWFNPSSFETSEWFTMIGIVCGLAIYNFTIINLPFPLALYKKLLDVSTEELSDLAELTPTTAKSLQGLLDYPEKDVEDVFGLSFSINESYFGEVVTKPLKQGGENINVTSTNKGEYVSLYVDYLLNKSCSAQFSAFKAGFLKVLNKQVLHLFQAKELMALVIGNENYNWPQFQQNCEYKEGYDKNHQTVQFFWQTFRELSEDDKRKFLLFLTGSDRIPVRGMESVKMTIQRTSDVNFLPVAHTCFNLLDLPEYTTKEKLKFKLLQAIQQTKGFGLV